jgi:hypothetical protein
VGELTCAQHAADDPHTTPVDLESAAESCVRENWRQLPPFEKSMPTDWLAATMLTFFC